MANTNAKKPKSFFCDLCNYSCSVERDYKKHTETLKHRTHLITNKKIEKKTHDCICNKTYSHMSSLSKHRSKCEHYIKFINNAKSIDINTYDETVAETQSNNTTANLLNTNTRENNNINNHCETPQQLLLDLLSQSKEEMRNIIQEKAREILTEGNNELKNILINEISSFYKEQHIQKDQLNKRKKKKKNVNVMTQNNMIINNNNSINNINNNNNRISLNIILDEACNTALNMDEFIKSLPIGTDTVEYTGKNGFAKSISKLFIDRLNQLHIKERPIHCTDVNREVFYIKDNNKWERDTNNILIHKAISRVADKNFRKIQQWTEENPLFDTPDTRAYEAYLTIMQESIGGRDKKVEKRNNSKIIKNIAKQVYLPRGDCVYFNEIYKNNKILNSQNEYLSESDEELDGSEYYSDSDSDNDSVSVSDSDS